MTPGIAGAGGVGHGVLPAVLLQVESLTGTKTLRFVESAATECEPAPAGSCTSAITDLELASITATQEFVCPPTKPGGFGVVRIATDRAHPLEELLSGA
jgi:hypothetical protein